MTRDDPAAFAPPPAFGPFRVLHQIGIGALGPVFRTYEPTRDRLVAVKLFRLDITPEQAQALADELSRACDAGLFHPSIVEPIAAGVQGTAAYRAEEYVAAESLDVAMRHYAPASVDKALPFITQLAGAIDFARTAGVGHGGLHLRDVFVTPDEARASGFGIVESLERAGIRAPVRRPYSAPERIAGAAWSTPADVFSLAAITYELLTARRPAGTGDQIGALAGEHIGARSPAVHAVLARAMDEDPARRYSTALGFASALEAAAHGGAVGDAVTAVGEKSADRSADLPAEPLPPFAATISPGDAQRGAGVPVEPRHEPALPVRAVEPEPAPVPRLESAADVLKPVEVAQPEEEEEEREGARTLFGEEVEGGLSGHVAAEATLRPAEPPKWQYEPVAETPAMESYEPLTAPERSRIATLPVALGLILGLLIGFAGGYAVGGRKGERVPPTTAAAGANAAPISPQPSRSEPQPSGRAWSEQTVGRPAGAPPAGREGSPNADGRPRTVPPPVPEDAPSAAAPRALRPTLTVESTPKNAVVTVNGKWRGRTPVTIDDLTFGTHTVRIVQPGYTVAREVVTLTRAQPARTVRLQLQRPAAAAPPEARARPSRQAASSADRFSGSLFVASNPPGARVFVDGRPFGTAPARIPEVSIGSHVVRLELPDHRIWTTSTRVTAGQETRVTGSLERLQ